MAKKKNSLSYGKLAAFVAALLGLVAVFMILAPCVAVKDADSVYKGLQVTFGYKQNVVVIGEVTVFNFAFMNLLTYILALIGVVTALLGAFNKGGKLTSFISAIAFLAAGIFFFCTVAFTSVNADASKIWTAFGSDIKKHFALGAGAIVGGIFSILSALAMGYKTLAKN